MVKVKYHTGPGRRSTGFLPNSYHSEEEALSAIVDVLESDGTGTYSVWSREKGSRERDVFRLLFCVDGNAERLVREKAPVEDRPAPTILLEGRDAEALAQFFPSEDCVPTFSEVAGAIKRRAADTYILLAVSEGIWRDHPPLWEILTDEHNRRFNS